MDYLCRVLASINAAVGGEALPAWRNTYLTDYHDLPLLDAEEDAEEEEFDAEPV